MQGCRTSTYMLVKEALIAQCHSMPLEFLQDSFWTSWQGGNFLLLLWPHFLTVFQTIPKGMRYIDNDQSHQPMKFINAHSMIFFVGCKTVKTLFNKENASSPMETKMNYHQNGAPSTYLHIFMGVEKCANLIKVWPCHERSGKKEWKATKRVPVWWMWNSTNTSECGPAPSCHNSKKR